MSDYADPHVLVSTDWLDVHGIDPNVVLVEVDEQVELYEHGHLPGAIAWNWQTDLADKLRRDILGPCELEALLSKSGIGNTTTVVLYGDKGNWCAAWAFWQLKIHGHRDVRILNGGREKWIAEGRPLSKEIPSTKPSTYRCRSLNLELRALLPQVKIAVKSQGYAIVDVRSPDEFVGKVVAGTAAQTAQRAGHIPGARSIPWETVCEKDGTFKNADKLRELFESKGLLPDREIITYSRAGEHSSHTWFVLKHLLGYPVVKNYDGSWAEWGNLVGVAIEQGDERPPRYQRFGEDSRGQGRGDLQERNERTRPTV
jgi:thiosulfate/3-mercaptopyruvate sulfurtransferase